MYQWRVKHTLVKESIVNSPVQHVYPSAGVSQKRNSRLTFTGGDKKIGSQTKFRVHQPLFIPTRPHGYGSDMVTKTLPSTLLLC